MAEHMDRKVATTVPALPAIRQETVQDQVYQTLRTAIIAGRFKPGQRMTIRSLAQELGTSAMPVRDAVGRLSNERALEVLRNRAIVVPLMTVDKLRELTTIRIEVEGLAAEHAAAGITPQELRQLRKISDAFLAAGRDGDLTRYMAKNQEFHFSIYRAAGMPLLTRIIESLWLQFGPTLHALLTRYALSEYDTSHHDAALAALAAGDGPAARAAIAGDLRDAADEMIGSGYFAEPGHP
jgi:DNA-binding GntR family transcriptional regulator